MPEDIIWRPNEDFLENSNVARFMKKHGLASYEELLDYFREDVGRFWEAIEKDMGVSWYRPYDQIMDPSGGLPWTKWFLGGELNIVHNCIDRHLTTPTRDRDGPHLGG